MGILFEKSLHQARSSWMWYHIGPLPNPVKQAVGSAIVSYLLNILFRPDATERIDQCFLCVSVIFIVCCNGFFHQAVSKAISAMDFNADISYFSWWPFILCTGFSVNGKRDGTQVMEHQSCTKRSVSLSDKDSFLSTDAVAAMTLQDVTDVFSYASQANQTGFNRNDFFRTSAQRTAAKRAIHALDCATSWSRGPNFKLSQDPTGSSSDSMDALLFCAAVRIYAEWRSIRGNPSGYPTYSLGLNMARKDLVQNLRKIENAIHAMMDSEQQQQDDLLSSSGQGMLLTTPTLRQVLEHEVIGNLHPRLPILSERSGASGFLWTKRQIAYQNSTLENNAKVPFDFQTPKAAFLAAYDLVYGKFHNFPTRTMFKTTIDRVPPSDVVLRHMNVPYIQDEENSCFRETKGTTFRPRTWTEQTVDDDESTSSDGGDTNSEKSPIPQPGGYVDGETDNPFQAGENCANILFSVFGPCISGDDEDESQDTRNVMSSVPAKATENGVEIEHNDVPYFLSVLRPLEEGWDHLLAELNMDDPSRA